MKQLLKKASLTVATACLVAAGLVSVGWAHSDGATKSDRRSASTAACFDSKLWQNSAISSDGPPSPASMPKYMEINGNIYMKGMTNGRVAIIIGAPEPRPTDPTCVFIQALGRDFCF